MIAIALLLLAAAPEKDLQFLKDLTETRTWRLGRPTAVKVTPDGARVLFLRALARKPENRLYSFDVKSGETRELISPEQVLKGAQEQLSAEERARRERMRVTARGFTSYDLSDDGARVLVTLSGHAYVLPTAGGEAQEVAGPDEHSHPIFDPRLSPDGKSVSFVRAGELWVAPAAAHSKPRQLTKGATETLLHAQAEFVAQEELDRYTGYWWSPDSSQLVYEEVDNSGVEKLDFTDPAHPERGQTAYYPRPGHPNAKTRFGLVAAQGGPTRWIEREPKYEYVARVLWQKNAPLTMLLLTREQKDLALVAVDPRTAKPHALLTEHDDVWLNAGERENRSLTWLRDGSGFLWSTETAGFWQLTLHKPDGALDKTLTAPDFGFDGIAHVDPAGQSLVVRRSPDAIDVQLWEVPLQGATPAKALTQGPELHNAVYARDSGAFVLLTGSAKQTVVSSDGKIIGDLPAVNEQPPFEPRVEIVQLEGIWCAIVRPHDFDARKKYPVLLDVYGGPHVQTVARAPDRYLTDQWIADHGFIIAKADGRGTPGHGRAWERAIAGKLAEIPLEDQVKALQAMAAHEPAMDLTRVAVQGHSFGGFLAAVATMHRPDLFKAGIAGAPVVDWLNYDTCYTERYLGIPPPDGKADDYEKNSVLPFAKELQRPLLLLHGTADDNVHFEESLTLLDAVFKAGKSAQVDFLPQVGQTHMFFQPELMQRYWQRVFDFLDKNLQRQ